MPLTALQHIKLVAKPAPCGPQPLPAQSAVSHALLQRRCELVASHSSLPAVVQGANCLSVSDWVDSLQGYLAGALMLVALASISIATIACSNGVQLVTIAGALQAFFAWGLLLHIARLPTLPEAPSAGVGWPWLLQRAWGVFCLLPDCC